MINEVRKLAYLFRASRPNRPLLLLGAGASYRSGIPLAYDAVKRIARAAYARHVCGIDEHLCNPKPSDWLPYLQQQDWFISAPERLGENFPLAVEHLLHPREFRREFFEKMILPPNGLNKGYLHLAEIVKRRLCWTILTTNFDPLIVNALRERPPYIHNIIEVNRTHDDWVRFNIYNRCQVIYLHGAVEYYRDKNLIDETKQFDDQLIKRIRPLLNDSPLIVVGYRGAETSVMNHLLEEGIKECGGYRHGIYWCILRGESLHKNVQDLRNKIGSNFQLLEIDGFDELMQALNSELENEAWYSVDSLFDINPSFQQAQLPFDHQPMEDVTFDDLDHDLILATLVEYCRRLRLPEVNHQNYISLMCEQGLFVRKDDRLIPTRGCYLLFGRNVPNQFPYVRISFTFAGKKRIVFDGNLLTIAS